MNGAESGEVLWKGRCKTEKDLEMGYPWGSTLGHIVVKEFIIFMKIECSLSCSQDISTGPCSEPDEFTQHPQILFLYNTYFCAIIMPILGLSKHCQCSELSNEILYVSVPHVRLFPNHCLIL